MKHAVHFSSKRDDWATPQALFDELHREFGFTLDACASRENAKCARFYTRRDDAMGKNWGGQIVFMNPPYGRTETGRWVRKAFEESQRGATVVCLVPSRTDTRWFHNYALPHGELRFIKGRVKFVGAKDAAPFPSLVVIFRKGGAVK